MFYEAGARYPTSAEQTSFTAGSAASPARHILAHRPNHERSRSFRGWFAGWFPYDERSQPSTSDRTCSDRGDDPEAKNRKGHCQEYGFSTVGDCLYARQGSAISFQRSRPPCAFTASFSNSFILIVPFLFAVVGKGENNQNHFPTCSIPVSVELV